MNRLSWRDRPEAWSAAIAVVVLVAALVTLLVIQVRAHQEQADLDAQEESAWENRQEMDQLLVDTATYLGVEGEPQAEQETTLTCLRNDGREGDSYFLHPIESDQAPDDVDTLLDDAAQYLQDRGQTIGRREMGDAKGVIATSPEGAVLQVVAGPGGVTLAGETMCALTDGAPGSDDAGG